MVNALFDNHMNIEQSEEIAIQYLGGGVLK